jgi:hypothetical protein
LKKGGDLPYKEFLDNLVSTRKVLAAEKKEDIANEGWRLRKQKSGELLPRSVGRPCLSVES